MPVFNDTDDSDAWRDDESVTSTDGFSSHTGDLESVEDSDEYEFLSRSSSRAQTEEEGEETDSDDQVSTHLTYTTGSVVTGIGSNDTSVVTMEDSMEELANTVLQSTELPRVVPETEAMEDSTATVTPPRQRRDTVTQTPHNTAPSGKPFNIMWAGSEVPRHNVIKKIGQSLMAATLQDKPLDTSASDWSNGYTNVVPVTDFTSDTAPEVEFVEDSLVKMRVVDFDGLNCGLNTRRTKTFSCRLHENVVNCLHTRKFTTCPWVENPNTFPSLIVYCSTPRGERTFIDLKDLVLFAEFHHIPLLIISDSEKVDKRFSYSWNHTNIPIPESEGREVMLGYQPLTVRRFMDLDLATLGLSLRKNEEISQDAIKTVEKVPTRFNLEKHAKIRIAAGVLVALLLLFFKLPFLASKSAAPLQVKPNYPLANTPSIKDLGTQYGKSSLSPSTITVTETEHMTITIPVVQTMTVSTTVTPEQQKSSARKTSTIVLHPIVSSVNVPRASIIPRLPNVDYGYAFGYDDDFAQLYLETENSLLLRLPGVYRESTTSRSAVKVAITRDGKPIHVDLREWKKNDLAFVDWAPEDAYGQLKVKVWTDATPIFIEEVIVDYTEYFFPPQYWEMIERSQKVTWNNLKKMVERADSLANSLAKDIHSRVADPAKYAADVDRHINEYMRKAKHAQSEVLKAAEERYRNLKSHYPNFNNERWNLKNHAGQIKEQTWTLKDHTSRNLALVISLAQEEAVRLTNLMKSPSVVDKVKSYWADPASLIRKAKDSQIDRVPATEKKCKRC